jgi:hypothetical protein
MAAKGFLSCTVESVPLKQQGCSLLGTLDISINAEYEACVLIRIESVCQNMLREYRYCRHNRYRVMVAFSFWLSQNFEIRKPKIQM